VTLRIDVITLFPAMFEGPLGASIPARAIERGLVEIAIVDLRQFGLGRHRVVDDTTYGGGAGMVLRPEPVVAAIESVRRTGSIVILVDPAGEPFRQERARALAAGAHFVVVCPRYEGVDERVRRHVDLELSIGDFVVSGGELPALVVIDAVIRLLPGAIDADSTVEESYANGLLEYPQYTRPVEFRGERVPDVLLTGNHERIRRWRLRESLRRTAARRPDLLAARALSEEERALLDDIRSQASERSGDA
jgi:tRNA (guanine37-N1)-methyltransferase